MMNPYRTLPRLGPEIDPELDRIAVPFRVPVVRGGWIVVTPSVLRFEPRFGLPREVSIDDGLDALQLSFAFDVDQRAAWIAAWREIVASAPYQQPLAHARRGVVEIAHAHSIGRGVDPMRPFAVVIDGDRLIAIEAAPAALLGFRLPEHHVPREVGPLLGRALAWLGPEAFAEMLGRFREHGPRPLYRAFTREQVRDRPAYSVEDDRFELLGTSSRDAIALQPSLGESVMLARWAAGDHLR
jgi:hypothetical protein